LQNREGKISDRRRQISSPSPNEKKSFLRKSERRLILKSAADVSAQKGFYEATISRIAPRAEIAGGDV